MLKVVFEKLFKMREKNASRARPGADDGFDAHEKPFLDHLEDLRHTLMKIGGTLFVATLICFTFHQQLFDLVKIPAKLPLAEIAEGVPLWNKLDLITLKPQEFILLMLKLSFFSAVIISFPFTVYFLFQFIIPGLRQVEKRTIIPGALIGFVLFLIGVCFAFFLATPIALKFFYTFENSRMTNLDPTQQAIEKNISDVSLIGVDGEKILPFEPNNEDPPDPSEDATNASASPDMQAEIRKYIMESFATVESANFALRYDEAREKIVLVEAKGGKSVYQIGEYITFIARLVLVFGISFQLPVIVSILVKLELLTARVMRATRTYAWIIILVAAAILTPPDLITLCLLGGPMILLYEICIVIATIMERNREKRERAEEEAHRSRLERLYMKPADDLTEEEKEEMHRAEIEQYEREHAHLYEEESEHESDEKVERDGFHGGDHPHGEDGDHHGEHDESWHEDGQYWHDGHEDDPHHHDHDEAHEPVQDWPDKPDESKDPGSGEMESDHAEQENLTPDDQQDEDDWDEEVDGCRPDGPVVDLNTASAEEMMTLPGIGPKLAASIIDHRPFETFDDLEIVPGLSQEKITKMVDRLMLG